MGNRTTIGGMSLLRAGIYFFTTIGVLSILWFTRLQGLGDRPFSRDEYYSATAVQRVVEHGVPAFYGGGHYTRALPMQYATAALCGIFGDNETTHRILPAVFGLLSIPLLYFLARRFMPLGVAVAVTAMFALSSWQIEFSRFARMYTALQFFTLAFFLTFYLAFRERRPRWTYVPHLTVLAAITLHDLGALLLPFLFVAPWIPSGLSGRSQVARKWKLIGAAVITGGLGFAWLAIGKIWWKLGVVDPLPVNWVPPGEPGPLQRLLDTVSIPGIDPRIAFLAFALVNVLTALAILIRFKDKGSRTSLWLGVSVMFIAALFHQFALWGLAIVYLVWRHDLHRVIRTRPAVVVAVASSCVLVAGWTLLALMRPDWLGGFDSSDRLRAIREMFLGFPDFYSSGISPWVRAMPIFTVLALAGFAYEFWRIRRLPFRDLLWHPLTVVTYLALIFGAIGLPLSVTRYWFFVYPFILLVPAIAVFHLLRKVEARHSGVPGVAATAIILLGIFVVTEDFNLGHIVSPNRNDVVYRTGKFARFSRHWYPRSDERVPALELAKHAAPDTKIILSSILTTTAYYLPATIKPAMYMPRDLDPRFARHSRNRGTMDRWSGYQLLTDPDGVRAYTAGTSKVLVARVISSRFQNLIPEEIWGSRLVSCERIAVSEDGLNEVLAVTLSKPL